MNKLPKYFNDGTAWGRARNRSIMCTRVDYWRNAQQAKAGRGMDGKTPIIHCDSDQHGGNDHFRDTRPVHDIWDEQVRRGERYAREVHSGWYTDPDSCSSKDGTGLCWGIVARLPHGRFLAGYEMGGSGQQVFFCDVHDDERTAANMADQHARVVAERECEYQQRWREAQELQDKIETGLRRLRELLALRHRKCMEYVRAELADVIESIRDARETLATGYKDIEV